MEVKEDRIWIKIDGLPRRPITMGEFSVVIPNLDQWELSEMHEWGAVRLAEGVFRIYIELLFGEPVERKWVLDNLKVFCTYHTVNPSDIDFVNWDNEPNEDD